jgi:hypothetical protein
MPAVERAVAGLLDVVESLAEIEDILPQFTLHGHGALASGATKAGRLHHKSLSDEHFFEVVFVQGGEEAFGFDADLLAGLVLQ